MTSLLNILNGLGRNNYDLIYCSFFLFLAIIAQAAFTKGTDKIFWIGLNAFLLSANVFFGTANLSKEKIEQHQYQKYCTHFYPSSELTDKGCFLGSTVYSIPDWMKFPTDFISLSDKKDEEVEKND